MKVTKEGFKDFSDEQLMLALKQGEKLAFNELYTRYSDKLYGYLLKMLWYNEVRAQDLLQDVFTKIITQPHLFDTNRNFKTWVYTIAANLCKNEFKRNEVRKGTVNGVENQVAISSAVICSVPCEPIRITSLPMRTSGMSSTRMIVFSMLTRPITGARLPSTSTHFQRDGARRMPSA